MTAAEKILQKALVTSNLDSKGWNQIQAALRDRAFFSSQVENVRTLAALRNNVAELATSGKSPSEIRRDIRQYLDQVGYDAGDKTGTIKDLRTKARLDIIMKTNAEQAKGYVSFLRATTEGAILAFPAYELVRVKERKMKRDWSARWRKAASAVNYEGVAKGGRMIALKMSPIWRELSVFGNPFPPFDFNSGMGLKDVSKKICREIGLLKADEQPEVPPQPDFNAHLKAAIPAGRWDGEVMKLLKEKFGDQLFVRQDQKTGAVSVQWQRCILRDMFNAPADYPSNKGWSLGKATDNLLKACDKTDPRLRSLVENHGLNLNASIARHTIKEGHWLTDKRKDNMPVLPGDLDLVPEMWRNPDFVERGKDNNSLVLCVDTFDGGILKMPIHINRNTPFGTGLYKMKHP